MSAMICSLSISISISNMSPATVKRDGINDVMRTRPARSRRAADQSSGQTCCMFYRARRGTTANTTSIT
jgi:hypothetical protein